MPRLFNISDIRGRSARCSPTDHSRSRAGCRNSRTTEIPRVTLVGHIVHRVIEVEVVVGHPVHGVPQVVDAGERVAALHMVGMFEESVGRVIRTERCAQRGNPDARRLALGIDERENFVRHIGVVNTGACIQLRWNGCAPLFANESLCTPLMQKIRMRPRLAPAEAEADAMSWLHLPSPFVAGRSGSEVWATP